MYVSLAGFESVLTENISYKTNYLPIKKQDYDFLIDQLADGDYSFLQIQDGRAVEYVKVRNICDRIMIERGAEQTRTHSFKCGTPIAFVLTMRSIQDTICQMEQCDE